MDILHDSEHNNSEHVTIHVHATVTIMLLYSKYMYTYIYLPHQEWKGPTGVALVIVKVELHKCNQFSSWTWFVNCLKFDQVFVQLAPKI